eukprot:3498133-Pleurochrysis_carterae.AAC.2
MHAVLNIKEEKPCVSRVQQALHERAFKSSRACGSGDDEAAKLRRVASVDGVCGRGGEGDQGLRFGRLRCLVDNEPLHVWHRAHGEGARDAQCAKDDRGRSEHL